MKCGKLTAKLRDAVPVRFYENGREIKRYKNIEIPDAIKELEFRDFRFDVPESGPITFKIFFAPGTLPETWPDARQHLRQPMQVLAQDSRARLPIRVLWHKTKETSSWSVITWVEIRCRGQILVQRPQPMQMPGSTTATLFLLSVIAP